MKIQIFFCSLATLFAVLFLSVDGQSSLLEKYQDRLALSFYSSGVPVHFIVVDKSKQKLMVFEQHESLKLLKTFVCATGENSGKKSISGDSKTPEGVYFITEIYEDKKITVFGSRAYHLDYPNVFDKHAGHLGDGIFIHGTNKKLIPYSTNGCITLANKDLDELATYLAINAVPIIILENLSAPLLGTDLKMIKNGTRFNEVLHELALPPRYFSPDNVETLSFLTLGSQAIASISYKIYDGDYLEYRYHKRAYLAAAVSKSWRNVFSVESQDTTPTLLALHPVKNQSVEQIAPPETVAAPMNVIEEPLAFVERWKTTWTAKDIDTYIESYSPSFKNGRLEEKKNYLNKR